MSDDDFTLSVETFKYLFLNVSNLILWLPAFCLAVLLRVITHRWDHQLIFPICEHVPSNSETQYLIKTPCIQISVLSQQYFILSLLPPASTFPISGWPGGCLTWAHRTNRGGTSTRSLVR